MKKYYFIALAAISMALAACSPSASQLQKTLEEHPEALFSVIEKHPTKFFETVRKAQMAASEQGQAEQLKEEVTRVISELQNPKQPAVDSKRIHGNDTAPVTIIEYFDYNCGHCSHAHETVQKLKEQYGDKVRFVLKQFPVLDGRTKTSMLAAQYSEAVGLQGSDLKYKFHAEVMENQGDFHEGKEEFLKSTVKKIGADLAKVQRDRKSSKVKNLIKNDMDEATKFGFGGTPAFLINGAALPGNYPIDIFKQVIDHIVSGKATGDQKES